MSQVQKTFEEQLEAYLQGERRNPLTSTLTGGRILSALQQPLFMLRPPQGFGVLTTRGRKTGKKRRKCIRAIRDGDKVYVVSLPGRYSAWFRNIEADPHVKLRIAGGTFEGVAREIEDDAERERAKALYGGTVNAFDRMEYRAHRKGRPTPESIKAMHERWFTVCLPLVIELS